MSHSDFDEYAFRKYMNKKGAAYRNQAIELIRISLSLSRFAKQTFTQDAELSKVLQVCDEALLKAATVPKGQHPTSKHHFQRAIRKWRDYDTKFHQKKHIEDVKQRMEREKEKDEKWPSKQYKYEDPMSKVIEFRIMRNLTDPQPTVLWQVLNDDTEREEILWNFIRFDEDKRLTLSQNAHFYGLLPTSPIASSGSSLTKAILERWHDCHPEPIYVLTNTPGRVFFEINPPRAFDNVWDMNGTYILKSVCGELCTEGVFKDVQGNPHSFHVGPLDPQPGVGATMNPPTNLSPCVPANDLNDALRQGLQQPNIKILIKRCSGCTGLPVDACTNTVPGALDDEGTFSQAGSRIFLASFVVVVIVVFVTS